MAHENLTQVLSLVVQRLSAQNLLSAILHDHSGECCGKGSVDWLLRRAPLQDNFVMED